jgi:HAE1 family hydrophobic/amphiphilic exporter-1
MKLIDFCVRYPVSVLVGVILALLFGVISLTHLPLQMTPTVDRPEVSVETVYRGAAPEEAENEIVDRQEEKLNAVQNLREMVSTSSEGRGAITLRFDWGVQKDVARMEVAQKLDLVQDAPVDAERPVIRAVSSDEETPIAWIIVHTKRDINEVRQEGEDIIQPRLERIEGVGAVWMFGGQEREVHVVLDYAALTARGLTIAQVRDAILRENRNTKAGTIDEGKRRYLIRTVGQFTDLKQIEDVIITIQNGAPVFVRDIAAVRFGFKEQERSFRHFGNSTIGFGVLRRTGGNTVEVMRGVKKELAHLNSIYAQKDIRLEAVYDETDYIYDAVHLVTENLYEATILTVSVLLLFLRSVSSIFVIGLAIPISVITTFIIIDLLGRSLNIIMLAALAFAVGSVLDDSIVVLENIFRHREMGKSRLQATLDGAKEVWGAILATTLNDLAVFLPLIFVKDEVGQLFRDIAIATSISTLVSLLVAVTVVPMMSAHVLRLRVGEPRYKRLARFMDVILLSWLGEFFSTGLLGLLAWLQRGVVRRVFVALLLMVGSLALSWYWLPPLDYLPKGNRNLILAIVKLPPGLNLEHIEGILGALEKRYRQIPEIQHLFSVSRTENPLLGVIVRQDAADIKNMQRIVDEMRKRSFGIPGTRGVFVTQMSLFRRSGQLLGGTNIEIDIKGHGLDEVRDLASTLERQVRPLPGVNFVNSSFEWGNPELQVSVDRAKAAELGLSASEIGYMVETFIAGTKAGNFRERGKERDITLVGTTRGAVRTQELDGVVLRPPKGQPLRLADIAQIREAEGPTKIEHIDRDRAIKLTVNIKDEVPLQTAINTINAQVVEQTRQHLPAGYSINVSGQAKDLYKTWDTLKWSFLLAVIIIYLLMCSLYESFTYPVLILLSIPPAMVGGVLCLRIVNSGLSVFGMQLIPGDPTVKMDVLAMIGFIMTAGIVVKAAILLVGQAMHHMSEGMPPQEAILESVRNRLRPICMTASNVFGFLPLVVASGAGSELYRGMAAVELGGLALSTLFSLILVPVVFSLWVDTQAAFPRWRQRQPARSASVADAVELLSEREEVGD